MNNVGYEVIGREETTNRRTAALSEEEQLWLEEQLEQRRQKLGSKEEGYQSMQNTKCKLEGCAGNICLVFMQADRSAPGSVSRNVNPYGYN